MATDRPSLFHCPNCNALYHVIKVEAGPETVDRALTCRVCGSSFPSREGNAVLKYFLTRKSSRVQRGEGLRGREGDRAARKRSRLAIVSDQIADGRCIIDAQQALLGKLRAAGAPTHEAEGGPGDSSPTAGGVSSPAGAGGASSPVGAVSPVVEDGKSSGACRRAARRRRRVRPRAGPTSDRSARSRPGVPSHHSWAAQGPSTATRRAGVRPAAGRRPGPSGAAARRARARSSHRRTAAGAGVASPAGAAAPVARRRAARAAVRRRRAFGSGRSGAGAGRSGRTRRRGPPPAAGGRSPPCARAGRSTGS